ncbi:MULTISPECIES: 3'-5' exonuclease [unclassified Bradyrhizobium]|uniref:3'-5' exonuclease n=2 Tax=Bradyrhizobium TaxID=374 RepID=UPI002896F785|nr:MULTISPECIES: 3'-5' exonuclease [unclassified Bradyrhizobium]
METTYPFAPKLQCWSIDAFAFSYGPAWVAHSSTFIDIASSFSSTTPPLRQIPRAIKRLFHQASIGDQSYRFMFKGGPVDEVVAIDCETTGLNVRTDDVISIGAIKIRGNRILTSERFEGFVRPDASIRTDAIKIHRLRQVDVEHQVPIRKLLPDFLHFVGGRPLIGYYVDFDIAMLDKYILPFIGIKPPNPRIEISSLYYERKYGDAPLTSRSIFRFPQFSRTSTFLRFLNMTRSTTP